MSNFQIFPFGSKKISSGWVKKNPGQRQVSLLFTASQKSGPISNATWLLNDPFEQISMCLLSTRLTLESHNFHQLLGSRNFSLGYWETLTLFPLFEAWCDIQHIGKRASYRLTLKKQLYTKTFVREKWETLYIKVKSIYWIAEIETSIK